MKLIWRLHAIALAGGMVLAGTLVGQPRSQESPVRKPSKAAPARVWKSETTGKEYRVRIEGDRFYAEWANVPAESRGAYIRTECGRAGSKWVGTSRVYLKCEYVDKNNKRVRNWCYLTFQTEIETITPQRIVGRTGSIRGFDCKSCKLAATGMAEFVWVPK